MGKIKLIVCDIDGTVISPGKDRISTVLKETFIKAIEQGVEVMICSGRHYKFLQPSLFEDLPMKYIGTINGACLTDHDGNTLAKDAMNEEQVSVLTELCTKNGIGLGFKFEDNIVSYANHEIFAEGYVGYDDELKAMIINDDTDHSYHKTHGYPLGVFLIGEEKVIEPFKDAVPGMTFAWSFKEGYDVFQNKVTKATAVNHLINILNIGWENVIAFGDAGNDTPMLKAAGIGVAMGNSKDDVLEAADYVTETCENDGVAKALYDLGIIK